MIETALPDLRVDLARDDAPAGWFVGRRFVRYALEIGFGGGEHLAARASSERDTAFIGCEPFANGVGKLLAAVRDGDTHNIRIHDGDARDVLNVLPNAALDAAYLLYPDPWPKPRHRKRRFVDRGNLDALFRTMKPGAELLVASDDAACLERILDDVRLHGGFAGTEDRRPSDRSTPPEGWPGTRYETKALAAGRTPGYLRLVRRLAVGRSGEA